MASDFKVEVKGRDALQTILDNEDKIVAWLHEVGDEIAEDANERTKEVYPDIGFKAPPFAARDATTRKWGMPEVIVSANPKLKSPNADGSIGDYAQAKHSVLTKAMRASKKAWKAR